MSSRRHPAIPIHSLSELSSLGLEMRYMSTSMLQKEVDILGVHRDDHYIVLLQESGASAFMLDFHQYEVEGPTLLYILPGQVHAYRNARHATGWFMGIAPFLINDQFKSVLHYWTSPVPQQLTQEQVKSFRRPLTALFQQYNSDALAPFYKTIVQALLTAVVGMVADVYLLSDTDHARKEVRSTVITRTFKQLLGARFKTMKSPAAYAAEMNLSLSYLNEMVKAATGFTVSYWIQQEITLEAKRLLHHSQLSVKEVAYELGYEDVTYFSRLFSKVVQLTPGEFRRQHRE